MDCRHCGATGFDHELTQYCITCGKDLAIITCKSSSCIISKDQIILPDNATYCPVCGKRTTLEDIIPF